MIPIMPSDQVAGLMKQANTGQDPSPPPRSAGWSFRMALTLLPIPPRSTSSHGSYFISTVILLQP